MAYDTITPRSGVHDYPKLLARAVADRFLNRTAQQMPFPKNNGKTARARRYNKLAVPTSPMGDGITPDPSNVTADDITATILQWGAYIPLTDQQIDLYEDMVVPEFRDILAEQMAKRLETLDWAVITGGTNVFYANGSSRAAVNTIITTGDLKLIERDLLAAEADYYNKLIGGKPKDGTLPIAHSFLAIGHTDLKSDIENLTDFTPVHKYATPEMMVSRYEVGSWGSFRFVLHPWYTGYADAGGAKGAMLSTTGTSADVYPISFLTREAWASLNITGTANSGSVLYAPPKAQYGDQLAQNGSLGWKVYDAAMILNDSLMARLECAATAAPA